MKLSFASQAVSHNKNEQVADTEAQGVQGDKPISTRSLETLHEIAYRSGIYLEGKSLAKFDKVPEELTENEAKVLIWMMRSWAGPNLKNTANPLFKQT